MLGFHESVAGDHLLPVIGKLGSPAALAAGRAHHQGPVGQIVHRFHRVPGGLVAHPHALGGPSDGTTLVDMLQQLDATRPEITAAFPVQPKLT